MSHLEFTRVYDYSGQNESIVVPVILRAGAKQVRFAANVDTGSSFCLFGADIAAALGLTSDLGVRMRFRTANSGFDAFGHEVEISVLGVSTNSMVYFFADPND